jgi:hypothetical protein
LETRRNTFLTPALFEDGLELAMHMRLSDYLEVHRANNQHPEEALLEGLEKSHKAWTMRTKKGALLAIGGVVPLSEGLAMAWLLGSERIDNNQLSFMRGSKELLKEMRAYGTLINVVDSQNTRSIRWLEALGFTVSPECLPVGPKEWPFRFFFMSSPFK